jgi:anti-sigma-K factor RskA
VTEERDLHLLTAGYALDSLDEAERERFQRHLTQSDETRTEVAEMADTALLLGLASRPVTPSPELKINLMALIATTPQVAPLEESGLPRESGPLEQGAPVGPGAPGGPSGPVPPSEDVGPSLSLAPTSSRPDAEIPVSSRPDRVPTEEQQRVIRSLGSTETPATPSRAEAKAAHRWYSRPLNAVLAVAAAVALVASGALLNAGLGTGDDFQQAQADGFAELVAADDVEQTVTAVAGGGEATLLRSDDLQRSAVAIDGLPELAGDRTYQLWYIDAAGATSAGTVDAAGSGTTWRVLDGDAAADAAVGITVEPKGGSAAPTTDPLVVIAA